MAVDYYTLLTNEGIAYETACKAKGLPIKLTQMSVGDGNGAVYNPDATATALRREVWRGDINALLQDANNPSWLVAELSIPDDVGGWSVREAGIWTDTGVLYAIIKYPESYKPVLATSGAGKEFYIRAIFQTTNASSVTLVIDESVVKATRAWVVDYVAAELAKLDFKRSARAVATAPIILSGAQKIDGVSVIAGDRVLVTGQGAAKDNGIWIAANNAWQRALDADVSAEVTPGLVAVVEEGVQYADSAWQLVTNAPIVLGTTALTFELIAGKTGIGAGSYRSLTVDKYGRVVGGSNPTTLAGSGITDAYTKTEVEALLSNASALPVGVMAALPVNKIPPGWLEVDGSAKSIATYPDLAAFLGGAFNNGTEPAGYFRLPESRGEFLRGWDHGRGIDTGRALGSWQKGSAHSFDIGPSVGSVADRSGATTATDARSGLGYDAGDRTDYTLAQTVSVAGSNVNGITDSSEIAWGATRPRNVAVIWCIKAWNAPINQGNIDIASLAALAGQATEANLGTAKIATQVQVDAGVADDVIVTPKKMRWGFAASFGANGYVLFPSWLGSFLLQWVSVSTSASATTAFTWPLAFSAWVRAAGGVHSSAPVFGGLNTVTVNGGNADTYNPSAARVVGNIQAIGVGK